MNQITHIKLESIVAGDNDRTTFDLVKLQELADSIIAHGLFQPITVRPIASGFEIVAGERRFRACKLAGMTEIPAIIRDLNDEEASAIMLTENVARTDLDPIDEGLGYRKRIDRFGWTVADCAAKAGVSATRVHFRIKLLKLRSDLQGMVRSGNLELGYAQAIASSDLDANFQMLAIRELQACAKPTIGWFRKVCASLFTQQAQATMFGDPLFTGLPVVDPVVKEMAEPAHPSTTKAPHRGKNLEEVIKNQIAFWGAAAEGWSTIGKPFKRQECQAAALALENLL